MVRELFAQHEREIESLLDDLAVARREADDVEARVREHPALGLLGPEEVRRWCPVPDPPVSAAAPSVPPPGPARTTVVHRPRRPVGPGEAGGADAGRRAGDGTDAPPRAPMAVRYSWAWKVGVVVAVVGLLLLKFG